jgi:hypothetical protein
VAALWCWWTQRGGQGKKQQKDGARSGLVARHGLRERRKGRGRSPSQRRQRAAPAGLARRRGSRSGHRPDVEGRGVAAQATRAAGGRAARRVEQGAEGRRAAERCSGPGGGGGVQQKKKQRELGFGEDEGDLVVKCRKHRGLTVKYR